MAFLWFRHELEIGAHRMHSARSEATRLATGRISTPASARATTTGFWPACACSRWAGPVATVCKRARRHGRCRTLASSSVSRFRPVSRFQWGNSRFPQISQSVTRKAKRCALPAAWGAAGRTRDAYGLGRCGHHRARGSKAARSASLWCTRARRERTVKGGWPPGAAGRRPPGVCPGVRLH
jgi:hypothetical protein